MTFKDFTIGFIGAGSIGSLFGGYLAAIPPELFPGEVILFCRKAHSNAIRKRGLTLHTLNEILQISNIKAYANSKIIEARVKEDSNFHLDYLFLTVKTYDIESSLKEYINLVNIARRVVILQNGIGNEEIISKYCPIEKIIRIITSNGALLTEYGHVIHTGMGYTRIGAPYLEQLLNSRENLEDLKEDLKLLNDLLNVAGIESVIVDDINAECWEKVFVNIGINPFGALTQLRNGQLLEHKSIKVLMQGAVEEAVKIALKKGFVLSKKDFVLEMFDVAEKTSENKNSMLQDILKGKKTEIDLMNGKIVKYAEDLNLSVPINNMITALIKGLENAKD